MSNVTCMVLAAGQGTRMKSALPKGLHAILGKPMIVRLLETVAAVPAMRIVVVVGHEAERVREVVGEALPRRKLTFSLQRRQRGTGHAVAEGLAGVPRSSATVLVVNGDMPLVTAGSIRRLVKEHRRRRAAVTIATTRLEEHEGYGRVLRGGTGRVSVIKEERDCTPAELRVEELNAGLYCFSRRFLEASIGRLGRSNDQGEFYLTDLVEIASAAGEVVADVAIPGPEVRGINDRVELALVEEELLGRVREKVMRAGVTLRQPGTVLIEEDVAIGTDTTIDPRVILRGRTVIGRGCHIGTGCVLIDSRIEDGAVLKPYCVTEGAVVRSGAVVGPFARLRPGSDVGRGAHVGNFVELKKTVLGEGSKANHLSYLGDGIIGRNVNVGAGTIFCNYDGFGKHLTVLEDDVFVGSDSQLVAPVRVGKGSYIGSGSTITTDVPPGSLAIARAKQVTKPGRAELLRQLLKNRSREAGTGRGRSKRQRKG